MLVLVGSSCSRSGRDKTISETTLLMHTSRTTVSADEDHAAFLRTRARLNARNAEVPCIIKMASVGRCKYYYDKLFAATLTTVAARSPPPVAFRLDVRHAQPQPVSPGGAGGYTHAPVGVSQVSKGLGCITPSVSISLLSRSVLQRKASDCGVSIDESSLVTACVVSSV